MAATPDINARWRKRTARGIVQITYVKYCGECNTRFFTTVRSRRYCNHECRYQRNKQYVAGKYKEGKTAAISKQRRLEKKQQLVAANGGCCQLCGYDRCINALEFHHLDRRKKQYNVSQPPIDIALLEAKKCILLCANCHKEVEAGFRDLPTLQLAQ